MGTIACPSPPSTRWLSRTGVARAPPTSSRSPARCATAYERSSGSPSSTNPSSSGVTSSCRIGDVPFVVRVRLQAHGLDVRHRDRRDDVRLSSSRRPWQPEALVMGHRTYDGFAAAWPGRDGEFADRFNTMPKYVVSTTLTGPTWNNTHVVGSLD